MATMNRAQALLAIIHKLNDCVVELDNLQAGDVQGRISPVKHELRDALYPITEKIRLIAQLEYMESQS